jgi:copper transport protein
VRLWFAEPVAPVAGGIVVRAPSGRRVEGGPAAVEGAVLSVALAATEQGTYQVSWRVIAADTHPVRGGFAFSVGQVTVAPAGDRSPELASVAPVGLALRTVGRWLHFLGFALGFGVLLFWLAAARPLGMTDGGAAPLWRLVDLGIALLLVSEVVALLGQTASFGVEEMLDPAIVSGVMDGGFGRLLWLRVGAALLLWVLVAATRERGIGWAWAAAAVGLGVAGLAGASAHAGSFRPAELGLLANGLHVAAMGCWVGGLAGLIALRHGRAGGRGLATELALEPGRPLATGALGPAAWDAGCARGRVEPDWHAIAGRFGRLAIGALAVLTLSGAAMALVHLPTLGDLVGTTYGQVLVAKVGLALLAVLLAWRRRPGGELAVVTVVLLAAGLLVSLPPPR